MDQHFGIHLSILTFSITEQFSLSLLYVTQLCALHFLSQFINDIDHRQKTQLGVKGLEDFVNNLLKNNSFLDST